LNDDLVAEFARFTIMALIKPGVEKLFKRYVLNDDLVAAFARFTIMALIKPGVGKHFKRHAWH